MRYHNIFFAILRLYFWSIHMDKNLILPISFGLKLNSNLKQGWMVGSSSHLRIATRDPAHTWRETETPDLSTLQFTNESLQSNFLMECDWRLLFLSKVTVPGLLEWGNLWLVHDWLYLSYNKQPVLKICCGWPTVHGASRNPQVSGIAIKQWKIETLFILVVSFPSLIPKPQTHGF